MACELVVGCIEGNDPSEVRDCSIVLRKFVDWEPKWSSRESSQNQYRCLPCRYYYTANWKVARVTTVCIATAWWRRFSASCRWFCTFHNANWLGASESRKFRNTQKCEAGLRAFAPFLKNSAEFKANYVVNDIKFIGNGGFGSVFSCTYVLRIPHDYSGTRKLVHAQ